MLRLSRSIEDEQRGGWLEAGIQLEDGMRRKGAGNLHPSSLLSQLPSAGTYPPMVSQPQKKKYQFVIAIAS